MKSLFVQKCDSVNVNENKPDRVDLHNCMKLFTEPEVLAPEEAW